MGIRKEPIPPPALDKKPPAPPAPPVIIAIYLPFSSTGDKYGSWVEYTEPTNRLQTTTHLFKARLFPSKSAAKRFMEDYPSRCYELRRYPDRENA